MRSFFEKQLAKATLATGDVDLKALADLVVKAYEETDRDRNRTDRSLGLMAQELQQSNTRLLEAFNVIPEGLVLLDAKRRFVLWNRKFAELYKSARNKIAVGASFVDFVRASVEAGSFPDAAGQEERWIAERLEKNSLNHHTSEYRLSGDRWLRLEEQRTADGGSIGVHFDITDLKRREASFRLLFDDNPVPMWVLDPETYQFVGVNKAALSHYGYSREQFLAMTALDLRPAEDRDEFKNFMREATRTTSESTFRHLKADGTCIWVTVYGRSLVHEGRPARLSAIIDVTERRRAEEEVLHQKQQTEAAICNMSQGLIMFDAKGQLVLCNKRYVEMYKLNPETVKPGMTLRELLEHAKEAGTFSGDPEQYCQSILARVARGSGSAKVIALPDGRSLHRVAGPTTGGGWITTYEDVTERVEAQNQIEFLAHHDLLTGLPNRSTFNSVLFEALKEAKTRQQQIAVICLDVDRFKEVNDVFGHLTGDGLLCEIAKRFKEVAAGSFLARSGGDEFSLIVTDGEQPIVTQQLAEQLQAAIDSNIDASEHTLRVGISIGIAIYPADGMDEATLLANADAALSRAKREGRGTIRFFERKMDEQVRERRALQHNLRSAISHEEVQLFYQPQMSIGGDIVGFEALARWHLPTVGFIPPNIFIPVAEESGLILPLGEFILRRACTEAASWPRPLKIAVNLSPVQFQHGDLPAMVHTALLESGLAPHRLELEVTEGTLIGDHSRALSILRRLKTLGVGIAMDDFGTGYSSLSYLHSFPFDKIKIDQSFLFDFGHHPQSAAIIKAILGLGRGLCLPVCAEGVETQEQYDFLKAEGCDEIQGYLIGRPQLIEHYAAVVGRAVPSIQISNHAAA